MKKSGSFLLRETMKPEIDYIVEKYKDPLFAISFNICQSTEDAEDVLQDTFFKYYTLSKDFEHESHLKFWLIRVVINHSRDIVTSFWRKKKDKLGGIYPVPALYRAKGAKTAGGGDGFTGKIPYRGASVLL